ncbi:DNA polymerase III subunit beta [Sporosarcina thermotolerans]|uniref:Beta sliding clamp n=1 Tax=Sporosarcina thermotolerans TaxID=633404 RepID=A0AAW9A526_9BACL|nr:DNA polymerase III subunit beta [Sporosarcina thermotolerans]MDW0115959.1 DNA polymerase III subunit beta [Sporosarcina thermotolerans]WHT46833.1 DNA polymerase III subunit beta [Sporosarcina thermotolerans]
MKFTIKNSLFTAIVSELHKISSNKSLLPILSGIKIEARKDGVVLVGGNAELFIKKKFPLHINGETVVEVHEEGSVVVLSKHFVTLLKKLPDDIEISSDDMQSVLIKSGDIVTRLNGLRAADYPTLPEIKVLHSIEVNLTSLKEVIKQTIFAVSKSEEKPALTGVKMEFDNNKLICTATDSHRLSHREIQISYTEDSHSVIVPSKSLIELLQLKESSLATVHITIAKNMILFSTENTILYSVLIEGNYPNTQSLIPTDFATRITMNTKTLIAGIDRACVFSEEWKHNNVHLTIIDNTILKITTNSAGIGAIEEQQRISMVEGNTDVNMTFDGRFLLDALKGIQEEQVTISFYGVMKPAVITPEIETSYVQLISPVRS